MADDTATAMNDGTSMTGEPGSQGGASSGGSRGGVRETVKAKLAEQGGALRGQAQAKAREYAEQGKTKATDTLDGISRFINETAQSLDEQLGADLGEYVHRAADAVSEFAENLKQKDVDELLGDAREIVRRNPALAVGAAAAAGFVLVRLLKAAGSPTSGQSAGTAAGSSRTQAG